MPSSPQVLLFLFFGVFFFVVVVVAVPVCDGIVKVGYRTYPGKLGEPTTWPIVCDW